MEKEAKLFLLQPSFFYIFPLLFLIAFLFKWLSTTPTSHRNLPPSPPKLPIIGNLHQLGLHPHRSLQSLARQHGPLMLLRFGSVSALVASSSDAAHEIMETHDRIFSNRPKSSIASRLLYDFKDIAFAPYGEYWRQVKSIAVLQLLSHKRVQSFRRVREEETDLLIEKIREASSSSSLINFSDMFMSLTNDVVSRVALGRKYSGGEVKSKIKVLLKEVGELLGVFNVGDCIPWLGWVNRINGLDAKVERVAKESDEYLETIIQEHMDKEKGVISDYGESVEGKEMDFVDILLRIQRDNMTGFSIHKDTVKALIFDMFAAGTDTTYTVLEWAMAEILRHRKVMKELQNEVREIASGKSEITEDDIEKMHYLKAVIKETLRLHTPVPLLVPRESTKDVKILGYDVPAGTQVMINAWAIGRDPLLWEEPEEFRPERFLNCSIDFKGVHFQFIPFGAGRRGCPGIQFAIAINELALAKVVWKFDFALPGREGGENMDMTESTGITAHKKLPLLAVATPYCC